MSFPRRGLGGQTNVVEEHGRWTVYLDVALEDGASFEVVRHRIHDYGSEREATVAARYVGLGANRELPRPPSGA